MKFTKILLLTWMISLSKNHNYPNISPYRDSGYVGRYCTNTQLQQTTRSNGAMWHRKQWQKGKSWVAPTRFLRTTTLIKIWPNSPIPIPTFSFLSSFCFNPKNGDHTTAPRDLCLCLLSSVSLSVHQRNASLSRRQAPLASFFLFLSFLLRKNLSKWNLKRLIRITVSLTTKVFSRILNFLKATGTIYFGK